MERKKRFSKTQIQSLFSPSPKLEAYLELQPQKTWTIAELPEIGRSFGELRPLSQPKIVTFFATKGGVLKTTLAFNLARGAALHGIKTCVLGLDIQGDLTNALGFNNELNECDTLSEALEKLKFIQGLPNYFLKETALNEILHPTDLPPLWFIPETSELISLDQKLTHTRRREYWLKNNVIEPLKKTFDLIIIDCSPNWSQLITNALVSCDLLVSPLECKINHYKNLKLFETLMEEFKNEMGLSFQQVYIPTRWNSQRKLSNEIKKWYIENLSRCLPTAIRESTLGEEAMALHLSLMEYAPSPPPAQEMKQALSLIWSSLLKKEKSQRTITSTQENSLVSFA